MKKYIFKVKWLSIWKSLSIYTSIAVCVPLCIFIFIRCIQLGYEKSFEHLAPTEFLLLLLAFCAVMTSFSLLISLLMKRYKIIIENEVMSGLNYWGFRKQMPLIDACGASWFSSNGINAVVIHSSFHGKIYISDKTENLEELTGIIDSYIEKNA